MVRGRRQPGASGGMLPLLGLYALNQYWRLERKPPITATLVAANTLIYLRPKFLNPFLPKLDQVCFNPHLILKNKDLKRFFLSALYHLDEPHLVYNMMSLLWKGIQLENSMGSLEYASMVSVLLGLSQGITLLLAKSMLLFNYDKAYYQEYAVGFSGVLFAMKVVLNSRAGHYTNVHGLIIPARYAAWAELIIIQMFVPGTSFLGHLGGILAGIVYLKLKDMSSGSDPLTTLFRRVVGVLRSRLGFMRRFRSGQRISGRGTVGGGLWRCGACTFDNSGLLNECEICGNGRNLGGLSSLWSSEDEANNGVALEELRRRRVERFNR
ncbi:rhomboid-like protein 14, mitochondrial [Impatiens glandulifera]|uniref:rhomboid-like protein 14, mitochondrial n=1 Tax=Impatiens glandulifera TaxID=253017 RepID=UPI001FB0FC7A|nr:rhomboid-like protein 14, mitochondrial [Impatiens glandulifera]